MRRDMGMLGLPNKLSQWTDTHALHALIEKGHESAVILYLAFGTLIGNTDMHNGNLSFLIDEQMRPRSKSKCNNFRKEIIACPTTTPNSKQRNAH